MLLVTEIGSLLFQLLIYIVLYFHFIFLRVYSILKATYKFFIFVGCSRWKMNGCEGFAIFHCHWVSFYCHLYCIFWRHISSISDKLEIIWRNLMRLFSILIFRVTVSLVTYILLFNHHLSFNYFFMSYIVHSLFNISLLDSFRSLFHTHHAFSFSFFFTLVGGWEDEERDQTQHDGPGSGGQLATCKSAKNGWVPATSATQLNLPNLCQYQGEL